LYFAIYSDYVIEMVKRGLVEAFGLNSWGDHLVVSFSE